jgi:putative transposase
MLRGYKYRIYPTGEQKLRIDSTIGVCRLAYNLALGIKIVAYKEHGINLNSFDLCKQLPALREEYSWVRDACSQALQASVKKVDVAFKRFFNGGNFPKYKKKRSAGSFQCPAGKREVLWGASMLTVPKIPNIPIVLSKKFDGKIKTVTISKTATGKYFASILVESEEGYKKATPKWAAIGIDMGIKHFATLSTGEKIANPRHLRYELNRLRALQRRVSRKKKGSNNRRKANLKVALLHETITNRRNDFLHKLSTRLISDSQTDTICIEDLAVSNMLKNHKLAQAISDASWSEFIRQLEYKGRWNGKNVVKIDRFYASSKTCSSCGHKREALSIVERQWQCSCCGSIHDRDVNAAINIKNSGMGSPVEPVEFSSIEEAVKQESHTK